MKFRCGAIFPISSANAEYLFNRGRTVFVKYTKFNKLEKDSKLVFYVSKEKKLIGEGSVERIETVDPETAWARYGKRMFLNETEYKQYVEKSPVDKRNRRMAKITVFILKNLKQYRNPTQSIFPMTPSGCYLTLERSQKLGRLKRVTPLHKA